MQGHLAEVATDVNKAVGQISTSINTSIWSVIRCTSALTTTGDRYVYENRTLKIHDATQQLSTQHCAAVPILSPGQALLHGVHLPNAHTSCSTVPQAVSITLEISMVWEVQAHVLHGQRSSMSIHLCSRFSQDIPPFQC